MRGKPQPTTGVVIRLAAHGESNRIVELLTAEHGRVALFARGARASRRRFAGALDLFVTLHAQVQARATGMWNLVSADIVTARLGIRTELERIEAAARLCECARRLCPEYHEATSAFALLSQALDALERGDFAAAAVVYPKMLADAGLMPDCRCCSQCGRRDVPLAEWDAALARAPRCRDCAPDAPPMDHAMMRLLRGGAAQSRDEATRLEAVMRRWIELHAAGDRRSHATVVSGRR